jgi:[acyl-carrier-protein] S-malonyltransferase
VTPAPGSRTIPPTVSLVSRRPATSESPTLEAPASGAGPDRDAKIALLFPGQGAQEVGMGREFASRFEIARTTYEEANDILGYDLARICFEGPAERLTETDHCQPAILTTSVAAWRVATQEGLEGDLTMGHSLGEYAAIVASGGLSFEQALRLVRERVIATSEVARRVPGRMAAVLGLSDEEVEQLCAEAGEVWPANYNCPGQVVTSGLQHGVERLLSLSRSRGVTTRMLDIDGAFHSIVMAPAAERLREALKGVRIQTQTLPFLSATSAAVERGERIRTLLAQQLTAPVRFTATVLTALDLGINRFVEFGPRRVLTGLVRRVRPGTATYLVSTPADLPALAGMIARRD